MSYLRPDPSGPSERSQGEPTCEPIEAPVSGVPSDNTTVTAVLRSFEELGSTAQLIPLAGAVIECGACAGRSASTSFVVEHARRLEGASDPDDMLTVLAARCPRCGAVGTLVLGYGPSASEVDADISAALGAAQAAEAAGTDDRADRSWFGGDDDLESRPPCASSAVTDDDPMIAR